MSNRSKRQLSLVSVLAGVTVVTLAVAVLFVLVTNTRGSSSARSDLGSALATVTSIPTIVAQRIMPHHSLVAATATSPPSAIAGALTSADGFIPTDKTLSPFDVSQPAEGNLNHDLLQAVQQAANDAANDGIEIRINSGWRSARYQQYLLNQAVVEYGSLSEARKWVSTPELSSHVAGDAVDVAPTDADDWLKRYGSEYGLCQTYANEIWHFQLIVAPGAICPAPKANASDG